MAIRYICCLNKKDLSCFLKILRNYLHIIMYQKLDELIAKLPSLCGWLMISIKLSLEYFLVSRSPTELTQPTSFML